MAFLQRKNPKEAEIQRLKKQENRFLKKGAEKKSTYLDQLIAERVPNKLQETLDAAFAKSFTLIFEKGTNIIEKTYIKYWQTQFINPNKSIHIIHRQ